MQVEGKLPFQSLLQVTKKKKNKTNKSKTNHSPTQTKPKKIHHKAFAPSAPPQIYTYF